MLILVFRQVWSAGWLRVVFAGNHSSLGCDNINEINIHIINTLYLPSLLYTKMMYDQSVKTATALHPANDASKGTQSVGMSGVVDGISCYHSY